jgi:hypothetical protein
VVDWPHACRGAAFVDVVLLAPSVAMQGGPQPADLQPVPRWAFGQPSRPDRDRVRAGRLLHPTLSAAAPAWAADGPRVPGRPGRSHPPLAGWVGRRCRSPWPAAKKPPPPLPAGDAGDAGSGMPGSVPGYGARAGAGRSTLTRSGSCSSRVPNGLAFTPLSR